VVDDLSVGPRPVAVAEDDAKVLLISQTSPIRPSRRIAIAYLFEEVSMLHANTRRGQIILVTGRRAPGLVTGATPDTLCEQFISYT